MGFYEFLKPVLEDGKRKVALRWCGDGKSLLLILYGGGGTSPGDAGHEACEKSLDFALMKQEQQGCLCFRSLVQHLRDIAIGVGEERVEPPHCSAYAL